MYIRLFIFLAITFSLVLTANAQNRAPTVDDLLNVKSVDGAKISPDGKWVAYTVNETDWKQDA
ncbi:MAG: hypothetical protein J2P41_21905, partial [Blastocatellia bacterium]|nr:hypothetical protein [Blastocatellia bacterium]